MITLKNILYKGYCDEFWMNHAISLAYHAEEEGEVPVGAVLLDNNYEIIGEGWNCPIKKNDVTAHAEIIALKNGSKYIKNYRCVDTTMYVTLEPCLMCIGALIHARIKTLIFGLRKINNFKLGFLRSINNKIKYLGITHNILIKEGILENVCKNQISMFFYKRRLYNRIKKLDV